MITLVAAIAQNNCIGKNGEIPWHIPEDFKRMQEITKGKVLIMGRKTWESIPEKRRPLPERKNIVITRDVNYPLPPNVEHYATIEKALEAHPGEDIVGFGGQKIYEEMMPMADVLDITHVNQTIENGAAFFPAIDPAVWKESWREDHEGFSFVRYAR
ncbi:MAG TPA: hypothetical protein DCY48_03875 [Candidatus Magasanikbacteria bacterium]|nr:MAG: hypothetical protein A3I74_01640 [Candidatus Magasanikbacteria bacterium RIFCSPLOWO2_02_FULL_47_16]OGH79859.1 MAG: hypothetical protein A3C10_00140 [Candidatus Magasanikbacteria bacterium RIFCSPHIGHO2_02_FULL_48_18]OGH82099.1 MAG: hypothetical protein A3G08_04355 [Candidatus Magasanikbacteria bacterium RIFCSPLOWO2_12_FULL_47_9b]HAZ28883.1 hypothetical protein [Candidatus Magasanikbacteria bacterium]